MNEYQENLLYSARNRLQSIDNKLTIIIDTIKTMKIAVKVFMIYYVLIILYGKFHYLLPWD